MNSTDEKRQFKHSPEEHANFLSKFSFWWIKDVYILGTKGILKPEDIYRIKSELRSKGITEEFIQLWTDEMEKENPNIFRLLFKCFGKSILFWGMCYSALDIAMRISNSLCLGGLVDYFSQEEPEMTTTVGLMYAFGLLLSLAVSAISCHPYLLFVENIASYVKIGLSGLIYRKILRLPLSSIYESLNGRVINMMADDLNQFDRSLEYLHHALKGPCESIIFGYIIYHEIGVAGMVGVTVLLCFMPLQGFRILLNIFLAFLFNGCIYLAYMARKATQLQTKLSKQTDQRIRIMNEIIIGIRVIKMYGLEHVFENEIKKVRSTEIVITQSLYRIRSVLVSLSLLTRFSIFISLVTFIRLGNTVTPRNMFITFAFFNLLNWSMLWQWPLALIHCGHGYVAIKRIQDFLLNEEMRRYDSIEGFKENESFNRNIFPENEIDSINLTNITSKWIAGSNRISGIYNLNLHIASGELCAVVGPVGSGKSSLLHVITGELNIKTGHCEIYGRISYASQMPWIFEGTVRKNIVFTEKYDEEKFQNVLRVCCLDKDIERMPHADLTLVGECGFSLSGGQSSRINLARAIYRNADIYILDDTLAALDFKIGKYIVQHCILEYLAGKSRVIVTNEVQYFKYAQHLVVMLDGQIESDGTFEEIHNRRLLPFWNAKISDITTTKEELITGKSLTSVLTILDDDNYDVRRTEKQFQGSRIDVYRFYFSSLKSVPFLMLTIFLFILSQSLLSGVDFYISSWNVGANWESMLSASKIKTFSGPSETDVDDDHVLQMSDNTVYIRTYCALMVAASIATIYRTFEFFALCLSASIALHNNLFTSILRAKTKFFDSNPSGRILNRFSKDLLNIESKLAQALIEFIIFSLELLSSMIMVSIVVNFWMLIPSIVITIFFCALRYVFTNTSQCVQRIEAISLSPLYSYVNNTLQGLSTIRISNVENILQEEFYEHLDFNTAVTYLKSMTSRAFSAWVDGICLVYIGICSVTFVLYRGQASQENIGIALLHCINLIGMCQWGTHDSAEIEYEMTSVERIIEYTKITAEPSLQSDSNQQPPRHWPSCGEIIFKNVNFKYSISREFVLSNLNFKINAGEKIGIIGRTGAGKTSLIDALFRMEEYDGEIMIDGIATNTLGLHDLRKNISYIPQNPILFSGTLRFNLDPFSEVTDDELWNALDQVEIKEFIKTLPCGLDYKLVKNGLNFSMGQRQLICLARAIIRNNKILISDEATASVDPETNRLIQETIKLNFADCTVVTISHQLHNVMESDRIMVLQNGRIIEFDQPIVLLTKSDGYLRNLVDSNDPATRQMLTNLALKVI